MEKISERRALSVFWAHLVYTEAALQAIETTAPLAGPITDHLEKFEAVMKLDLQSQREVIRAQAHCVIADGNLDGGLRRAQNDALHEVRQDRKDRRYSTLFRENIHRMVRHALPKQVEVATEVVQKLALSIYDDAFRDRNVPLLTRLIEAGRAALDTRRRAAHDRVEARLEIAAWKEEASVLRQSVYGQLIDLAARNRQDRAWAEQFFMPVTRPSGANADGDEDTEEDPPEADPVVVET